MPSRFESLLSRIFGTKPVVEPMSLDAIAGQHWVRASHCGRDVYCISQQESDNLRPNGFFKGFNQHNIGFEYADVIIDGVTHHMLAIGCNDSVLCYKIAKNLADKAGAAPGTLEI